VVGLTTDAAAREASGHFDRSGAEVNLRIVFVQPGESEYHTLLAEADDCKQNAFGVSVIGHDHVNNFQYFAVPRRYRSELVGSKRF